MPHFSNGFFTEFHLDEQTSLSTLVGLMTTSTQLPSPRERILSTAIDLFYRQGYQATGINQIIAEAKVARASFYTHFPSKEDLLHQYAEAISQKDLDELDAGLEALSTARDKFYGLFTLLPEWLLMFDYRGCPFQILLAEAPANDERLHAISRQHHERLIQIIKRRAEDYRRVEPSLKPFDLDHLAKLYVILMDGAIAAAVAYRDRWPIDQALQTIQNMVEPDVR